MRILKPHKNYKDIMSYYKTIFKSKHIKVMVQEFYKPHFLELLIWIRGKSDGFYMLKGFKTIPLNIYAYKIKKLGKLNAEKLRIEAYLSRLDYKVMEDN